MSLKMPDKKFKTRDNVSYNLISLANVHDQASLNLRTQNKSTVSCSSHNLSTLRLLLFKIEL